MLKTSVLAGLVFVGLATIPTGDAQAFFGARHGCAGSWSSCRGAWRCDGGWGGCRGWHRRNCFGCRGCFGFQGRFGRQSCFGCQGCAGCQGCFGCAGGRRACHGCWGCAGGCAASFAPQGYVYATRTTPPSPNRVAIASTAVPSTSLTLHVPEDAKVILAGSDTTQTGKLRKFTTSQLRAGELWTDYKVVVELSKDGQLLRQERTVNLVGGESQELTFNFDSIELAQR